MFSLYLGVVWMRFYIDFEEVVEGKVGVVISYVLKDVLGDEELVKVVVNFFKDKLFDMI